MKQYSLREKLDDVNREMIKFINFGKPREERFRINKTWMLRNKHHSHLERNSISFDYNNITLNCNGSKLMVEKPIQLTKKD